MYRLHLIKITTTGKKHQPQVLVVVVEEVEGILVKTWKISKRNLFKKICKTWKTDIL
jgi:hypothetical protein